MDEGKRRRARRHTPTQLMDRPVTVPTCAGTVTISAEPRGQHYRIRIEYPDGLTIDQPDSGDAAKVAEA